MDVRSLVTPSQPEDVKRSINAGYEILRRYLVEKDKERQKLTLARLEKERSVVK